MVIKCKCIERIRNANGNIIKYKLKDFLGRQKTFSANELKRLVKEKKIKITNLTLTSDNKLIIKTNIENKKMTLKEMKKLCFFNTIKGDFKTFYDEYGNALPNDWWKEKVINFPCIQGNKIITKIPDKFFISFSFDEHERKFDFYKIVIPSTIKSIGWKSFENCENLKEVILPNSIIEINERAFAECTNLEKIIIPASVTYIGDYAFTQCKKLKNINIPNTINILNCGVFSGCKNLEKLNIPDNVEKIEKLALCSCTNLKDLKISKNITCIGDYAFAGCAFEKIQLPNTLVEMGDSVFCNCKNLKEITIPKNVTKFAAEGTDGGGVFADCVNLEKVTFLNIFSIFERIFWGCKKLKDLNIPSCVTKIGVAAYAECDGLKKIIIPGNIIIIDEYAFRKCKNLKEVTISNNVVKIGEGAFKDCNNLKTVILPKHLKKYVNKKVFWDNVNEIEFIYK